MVKSRTLILSVIFLLMLLQSPTTVSDTTGESLPLSENSFDISSNVVRLNLPYVLQSIAVGVTSHGSGIAFIHEGVFHFKNPVSLVDESVSIGTGSVYNETITGADMDGDNFTEFLVMKENATHMNIVMVDFDDSTVKEFGCDITDPVAIIVGDFDGDLVMDAAVYSETRIIIKNMSSGATMGIYSPSLQMIIKACSGNFLPIIGDEIAVLRNTIGLVAWIDILAGDGTVVRTAKCENDIGSDLTVFDIGDQYDSIAVLTFEALETYYGNLTSIYPINEDWKEEESYIRVGHFNNDTQQDFVIVSAERTLLMFVDGSTGLTLRWSSEECVSETHGKFAVAFLDSDSYTDIAIDGPRSQLTLVRGSNGMTGYEESRIPGPFIQVLNCDINEDGRDDIVTLTGRIAILISDTSPPEVVLDPMYPAHPTVYDSYIKIELTGTDNVDVVYAKVFMRSVGESMASPFLEYDMIEAPNGKYIHIMTGLSPGDSQYYIELMDPYLNTYSFGNSTHPEILTVEGHYAWGQNFNATVEQASQHVLEVGNSTSGDLRIFAMNVELLLNIATLQIFSPDGSFIDDFSIPIRNDMKSYEVHIGLLDGDNVLDPIIAGYNSTHTSLWIINGSDLTSMMNATYSVALSTTSNTIRVFDDDNDNFDEIHYVGSNNTHHLLLRIDDSLSSWTSISTVGDASVIGVAHAALYDSTIQLGILRNDNRLGIYEAHNLTLLKTLDYTSPGSTSGDEAFGIQRYLNTTHASEQFILVYKSWNVDTPTNYICLVDSQTGNIGEAPYYIVDGFHILAIESYDTDADIIDELFVFGDSGNVSLYKLIGAGDRQWTVFVSESAPLSTVFLDFDGNDLDELVISTSDDRLTTVSYDGNVEYQASLGMLFNLHSIGDIDVGPGNDIVSFPNLRTEHTLATIRNINSLYKLNISFSLDTDVTLQGNNVWANATILNVYDEPVTDASALLRVQYRFGNDIVEQIFGFVNDNETQYYSSLVTPNWPIGMVNMSYEINHQYYDSFSESYIDALRVESPLSVTLFVPPEINQGDDLEVNVTVTDSLGGRVIDANVTVIYDGTSYFPPYLEQSYYVLIPNIMSGTGLCPISAIVNHPFAISTVNQSTSFIVSGTFFANILTPSSEETFVQGTTIPFAVHVQGLGFTNISGADVTVLIHGGSFPLVETTPGIYTAEVTTVGLPLGEHNALITVSVGGSGTEQLTVPFSILGEARISVTSTPTVVMNNNEVTFNFTVTDLYGNPLSAFNYTVNFGQQFNISGISDDYRFSWMLVPNVPPGTYSLNVTIIGNYITYSSVEFEVQVWGSAEVTVISPLTNSSFIQGEDRIQFDVNVTDLSGFGISNCTVKIIIHDSIFLLSYHGNGIYSTNISTSGWKPNNYRYTLLVSHTQLIHDFSDTGEIVIIGRFQMHIDVSSENPLQNTTLIVTIHLTDNYAHPMTGANVTVIFNGTSYVAVETSNVGVYEAHIPIGLTPHDLYELIVQSEGAMCIGEYGESPESRFNVRVVVNPPSFSLDIDDFILITGFSFLFSFLGLLGYFRISSSLSITRKTPDTVVKSIKKMDYLYLGLVGVGGFIVLHSNVLAISGNFAMALAEGIILLGLSILLYGVWLYRDATFSILHANRISRRRMGLGLWHLFFVPLLIFQLFSWGSNIEWFQAYILEVTIDLGLLKIPTLIGTVFATYTSSIIIVVINLYREIRNNLSRLASMRISGTPSNVLENERVNIIGKLGSSIRIKFFMFLVILAGTTVASMDFLRSYSLGVVILVPVLFLVIVPYVSSQIIRNISRVYQRIRGVEKPEHSSHAITSDERIESSVQIDKEHKEPSEKTDEEKD